MADDVTTLQDYLTSPSKAQNVYADIQATIGNPVYLYLNGLVSGEQLYSDIQNLLFEPIDIAGADWKTLADDAERSGDELLIEGYSLIQAGLSPDRVRAKLSEKYADSYGELTDDENNQIEFMKSSLDTFAEAWNNAEDIQAKLSTGVYQQDDYGRILAPVDWQTGFSRLRSFGLDEYTANPDLWRQMPDPMLSSASNELAAQAGLLNQDFEKLAKETTKKSAKTAKTVYDEFLKKYGGAARADKGQGFPSTRGVTPSPTPVKPGKGTASQGGFAATRGVAPVPTAVKPSDKNANRAGFEITRKGSAAPSQASPSLGAQADYWAKLAASYAGRAAQEVNAKQLASMKKEAQTTAAQADQLKQAAIAMPNTRGLDMLQAATMLAARGGGGGGKPGPRVLSDEEINTMASMIAGSMQQ